MSKKYCYLFTEGNAKMRELLGGKGANLAEMTNIGLPVPQGFTITTEACTRYYEDGKKITPEIRAKSLIYRQIENVTGKKFGDRENHFCLGRSGARLDAGHDGHNLNLGLNEEVVNVMAENRATPLGGTATAASSRCTPTSSWGSARNTSSSSSTK